MFAPDWISPSTRIKPFFTKKPANFLDNIQDETEKLVSNAVDTTQDLVDDAVDHVENAVEITKDISSSTYEKTHEAVGIISDQAVDVYQKVKAKTLDGIDWAEDGLDKISEWLPVVLPVSSTYVKTSRSIWI